MPSWSGKADSRHSRIDFISIYGILVLRETLIRGGLAMSGLRYADLVRKPMDVLDMTSSDPRRI